MKCLSEVNTNHMRRLVARLLYHLQAKRRDCASSILKSRSKLPSFYDLVEFLQERASSENNPVFGNLKELNKTDVVRKKRYSDSNINAPRISSFKTQFAPKQSDHNADQTTPTNAANVVPDVYKGTTALPVMAVVDRGPDGQSKSMYALLDQASEATFIHSNLAKDLNLKGTRSTLSIKSLTGSTSINAEKVSVTVEAVERTHEDLKLLVRDVIITDNFDVHLKVVPRKDNLLGWKHLSDVNFPDVECEEIQMLIGLTIQQFSLPSQSELVDLVNCGHSNTNWAGL
ncbi:Hypothetical predicted protein [Paramuricea clavata]|uniref:Uncharacterized protein n=1 Tax=Paramuricea clavata TaxID=317549 RepID=A0A7D9IUU2_PARCT|nr:Hypothetical predicted protein [Paramuricea clavata]